MIVEMALSNNVFHQYIMNSSMQCPAVINWENSTACYEGLFLKDQSTEFPVNACNCECKPKPSEWGGFLQIIYTIGIYIQIPTLILSLFNLYTTYKLYQQGKNESRIAEDDPMYEHLLILGITLLELRKLPLEIAKELVLEFCRNVVRKTRSLAIRNG